MFELDTNLAIWLAGITVTIIGFEVSRMYLLTDKVRDIQHKLDRIEDKLDQILRELDK